MALWQTVSPRDTMHARYAAPKQNHAGPDHYQKMCIATNVVDGCPSTIHLERVQLHFMVCVKLKWHHQGWQWMI
jgi:hypothetical protein